MNNNVIQIYEYDSLRLNKDAKFKKSHFESLVKFSGRTNSKFFTVGHNKITFGQYVGVIQVKGLTIEILPKADKDNSAESYDKWRNALLSMLHECKLIKLESLTNAFLKLKSSSLVDLYFDVFLTEVEKLLRQGLSKKYRRIENNIDALKGKLSLNRHIKNNYIHKERFFCEYQNYDRNHLINQIILRALKLLCKLTNNHELLSRSERLLKNLEDIEDAIINENTFKKVRLDRNTERYDYSLRLAKLIILNYSPDLKSGDEDVLAILFDMNKLFENFTYRKLKKLEREHPELRIREQVRKKFWGTRGIKPDILVEDITNNRTLVIDTKWKVLKELKPSYEDLKQMFVYNHYYKTSLSILLYPKVQYDSEAKRPFHPYRTDSEDINCQLCFLDLFDDNQKLKVDLGEQIYKEFLEAELSTYSL